MKKMFFIGLAIPAVVASLAFAVPAFASDADHPCQKDIDEVQAKWDAQMSPGQGGKDGYAMAMFAGQSFGLAKYYCAKGELSKVQGYLNFARRHVGLPERS
jgi:hypothetical protein